MRSRISVAAVLLLVAVVSACDQRAPTDPARALDPNAAILDGSSGGNAHFFFLPPVVKKASFSGVFNGNVAPTVEICTNTLQTADGRCASLLARYKRFPQPGDAVEPIEVSLKGEKYTVNWNTKLYAAPLNVPFRLVVLVGGIQLGYVDLIRTSNNSVKNQTTGTTLNRTIDGTVPIDFRIENGALCSTTSTECFEGSVGPAGGTFTITRNDGTKPAGTQFPEGALTETVTLIIERYFGECLPTDAPQYQGCYKFRTEPHIENFEVPATVGVCLFDPAALTYFNSGQLRLWKWSEEAGDPILELERVTIEYLECPPITQIGMRTGSPLLLGAARASAFLFKPLASLLAPKAAYALAPYEGGKLINFSRIGWVRPLSVEVTGGNEQTGEAGEPLATPLSARVVNRYGNIVQGVPGRNITFSPSGDGSANPPSTFTDALGSASTIWTLSTTPGANSLLARAPTSRPIAPSPYEAEATFTANGTPPLTLKWLPVLGPVWDFSGNHQSGLSPEVIISVVNGPVLERLTAVDSGDKYGANWVLPQFDPALIYRVTVELNGTALGYIDLQVSDGALRNVATNAVVVAIGTYNIGITFRLLQ